MHGHGRQMICRYRSSIFFSFCWLQDLGSLLIIDDGMLEGNGRICYNVMKGKVVGLLFC